MRTLLDTCVLSELLRPGGAERVKARVKADGSGVDLANAKMTMNPFCENALEEALRLREAGVVEEIIVASVGGGKTEETLRHGLADRIARQTDHELIEQNNLRTTTDWQEGIKATAERREPIFTGR